MNNQIYNLTYPQKNIWLVEKYNGKSQINSIVGTIEIKDKFNVEICKNAINYVVRENDILRVNLEEKNEEVIQCFKDFLKFDIPVINMTDFSAKQIQKWKEKNAKIPLNLQENKLFEFYILKYSNTSGAIYMKIHHIICDAWGCGKMTTQAIKYIEKRLGNDTLEDKKYSYIDYILSQNEYTNSEKYKKDEIFWREYLKELNDTISLKSSITKSNMADRYHVILTKDETENINNYCKENKISPYVLFLTALSTYLYRVKDNNDFVIGTPVLNRANFKEKNVVGMCVSTLPLRIKIDENEKFIDLAKSISTNTLTIFRHQKYPYSKTLEYIHKNTDIKANIYNIMLSYQNVRADIVNEEIYSTTWPFTGALNDELQIHITDMDGTGCLNINYDYLTDLFDKKEIEYIHTRIMTIIKEAICDIQTDIENIRIISKEEENKILYEFNDTKVDYPKNKTVIELFEEQVKKNPDNIAIKFNDINLSYKDLNNKANILAYKLYKHILGNKIVSKNIGVIVSKKKQSIEMILAILKLGYTFIPIDEEYPVDRIKKIIETANITTCFVDKDYKDKLNLNISIIDNEIIEEEKEINYKKIENNNLYIIYTSGSTGDPKGVIIKNQNIINLLYSQIDRNLNFEKKNVLQFATMIFDVSYQEIFSAICFGATLVLIDEKIKKDSVKLCEYIEENNIEMLFIPPVYLRIICEIDSNIKCIKNTVKDIIVAGEQLIITENIKKLLKGTYIKIHNHYGPAETHVISTITYDYNSIKNINKVSIGTPINNTKILILDSKERLLPIGVHGEIVVSGDSVGNGYINDITSTNIFFKKINNELSYKTGDIGYYTNDGLICFVGREDFQIKVNGYRIEIEEIEKNILKLKYVSNCVIKIIENELKKEIVAVLELNEEVTIKKIKEELQNLLPKYMLPNKFYIVDKIPINSNGKIDRKSINLDKLNLLLSKNVYEKIINYDNKIINCIENVLKIEITNNFNLFDYGVDSLQVIKLQAEFMKQGFVISIQDIYDNPTVNEIIQFIKNEKKQELYEDNVLRKTVNDTKKIDKKIKKVLITGVTGYLGIHVLKSILEKYEYVEVVSLTRRYIDLSPEERVKEKIEYYFGKEYIEKYMSRIKIYESNLDEKYLGLKKEIYDKLKNEVDVLINCAALVSHYASKNIAEKSNLQSIINLIEFTKDTNIILNHISTIGVCGNGLVKNSNCIKNIFTEDDLYIGQDYKSNVYVYTKIMGENLLYRSMIDNVIKANVIRVGNLTNRFTDYKFQMNYTKNAFQSKIGEITFLGYIPKEILNNNYEMTPVDICSDNIIKVVFSTNYNGVYHIFNDNTLKLYEIVDIMEKIANKKINIISMDEFTSQLLNKKEQYGINTLFQDILIKNTNCIKVINKNTKEKGYSNFDDVNYNYYYNVLKNIWGNINERKK